jgi:DNA-binding transcriptional regulator YbjK
LDAAITLVGDGGVRALTHRAVDAAAGIPPGSTSNYFRTRQALLEAVVDRFAERERANYDALTSATRPRTPAALAGVLADLARGATGPHRTLTLARYALLVESAQHPVLQRKVASTGAEVNAWFRPWLGAVGSCDPGRDAPIVQNYVTGLVLHELAHPSHAFDPAPRITALVELLIDPARSS